MSGPPDQRVIVGQVSGLFGVKGWVKLFSHTAPIENLLDYKELELGGDDRWRPARLVEGKRHGEKLIGRFEGVEDRDDAARLVGADIAVRRSELPEPEGDQVYWIDLIGMQVTNVEGDELGTVLRLVETGAHDVLVVNGDRERLIPFVRGEFVKEVDLAAGRILVDWKTDY